MKLVIYYDNPSEASNLYLKWLTKDCMEQGVRFSIVDNIEDLKNEYKQDSYIRVLPMLPLKDDKTVKSFLYAHPLLDIDNVTKTNRYTSCTAQGIFNYIINTTPNREACISVIGRGVVGKELINMLINYGYTVMEFNSKSNHTGMKFLCSEFSDIVVGLADREVFNMRDCKRNFHSTILIDGGNCFNTKYKMRCGKWTRQEIINRILEND